MTAEPDAERDLVILRGRLLEFIEDVRRDHAPPLTHEDAIGLAVLRVAAEFNVEIGPRNKPLVAGEESADLLLAVLRFVRDAIPEHLLAVVVARSDEGDIGKWFAAWMKSRLGPAFDEGELFSEWAATATPARATRRGEEFGRTDLGRLYFAAVVTLRRSVTKGSDWHAAARAIVKPMLGRRATEDETTTALGAIRLAIKDGHAVGFLGRDGRLKLNTRLVKPIIATALAVPRLGRRDDGAKVVRTYHVRPPERPLSAAALTTTGEDVPEDLVRRLDENEAVRAVRAIRAALVDDPAALAYLDHEDGLPLEQAALQHGVTPKAVRCAERRVRAVAARIAPAFAE